MPRSSNANPIWEFFEADRENKRAKCKICKFSYSYVSTTNNLKSHLKKKHGLDNTDLTKDFENISSKLEIATAENDTGNNEISFIVKERKNASFLWKIFQKIEKYTAKCSLCDQNVRFKGTTGNLSVHLKRYHDDALEKIKEVMASNEDMALDSDEEVSSLHGQDIYFEELDDGEVKCTVCGKNISEAGEDPREHLEEHHPALLAKIIKNEESAEEREEGEEEAENEKEIFTEVVYLDQVSPPQTKKPQTKKPSTDNQRKRKLSTDSDEPSVKKKISEIESFTNYIRVLLEKLPHDVCSRLQLEIISLIMAAKLNLPSSPPTVSAAVAETVTITSGNNYGQEGNLNKLF